MIINYKMIKSKGACKEGLLWFLENFGKDDISLDDVIKRCSNSSYVDWLNSNFKPLDEIEKIARELESGEHVHSEQGITVVGKKNNKNYILTWHTAGGYFHYGFKPIDLIAYYHFGYGTTSKDNPLREYLKQCENNGMKIKMFSNLKDAVLFF